MIFVTIRQAIASLVHSSLQCYIYYAQLVVDQIHTTVDDRPIVEDSRGTTIDKTEVDADDTSESADPFESPGNSASKYKDDRATANRDKVASHAATRVHGKRCDCKTCCDRASTFPKSSSRQRRVYGRCRPRREKWADVTCMLSSPTEFVPGISNRQPFRHIQLTEQDSEAITTASEPDVDTMKESLGIRMPRAAPPVSSVCDRRLRDESPRKLTLGPNRFGPLEVERTADETRDFELGILDSILSVHRLSDETCSTSSVGSESEALNVGTGGRSSLGESYQSDELVALLDSDSGSTDVSSDMDIGLDDDDLRHCVSLMSSLSSPPSYYYSNTHARASRIPSKFARSILNQHCDPLFHHPAPLDLDGLTDDSTEAKKIMGGWSSENERVVKWASRVKGEHGHDQLEQRRWHPVDFSLVGDKKRDGMAYSRYQAV